LPDSEPRSVVERALFDELEPASVSKKWWAADERDLEDPADQVARMNIARQALRSEGMPAGVLLDIGLASLQFQQEGDDKAGYRIRSRVPPGVASTLNEAFYVVPENGKYVLTASDKQPHLIGWTVLRVAEAGDIESARKWLNWTRENITRGGGDDPLDGPPFAVFWTKDKATATADEVRLAAASLMVAKSVSGRAEPILLAAREKATTDEIRNAIDEVLLRIYAVREDTVKTTVVARRLFAALPSSPTAFNQLAGALAGSGNGAEAIKLAQARLEKMPRDVDAVRALGEASLSTEDYASSAKYYRQIIDDLTPSSNDYNTYAWLALFTSKDVEKAVEEARHASENGTTNSAALHTLAALYAETGKTIEARDMLMKRLDIVGREEPNSDDWYVLGRIAENYGITDAARTAYRKVDKPKVDIGGSSYQLAQRRLAVLSK
jgi:tetratricopeptide (TPR) repeat protein